MGAGTVGIEVIEVVAGTMEAIAQAAMWAEDSAAAVAITAILHIHTQFTIIIITPIIIQLIMAVAAMDILDIAEVMALVQVIEVRIGLAKKNCTEIDNYVFINCIVGGYGRRRFRG